MFHILYQLQIAICTGFMEETWSRNVLNILTTPVTEAEYILGVALFGLAKLVLAMAALTVMAIAFFGFNLTSVGWGLLPITAVLLLAGWSIGMAVIGLMLRYGQSAEILAWGINFLVMALSGVFNPVEAIPGAAAAPVAHPAHHPRLLRAAHAARRPAAAVGRDRRRSRRRRDLRRHLDLVLGPHAADVPPAGLRHPLLVDRARTKHGAAPLPHRAPSRAPGAGRAGGLPAPRPVAD